MLVLRFFDDVFNYAIRNLYYKHYKKNKFKFLFFIVLLVKFTRLKLKVILELEMGNIQLLKAVVAGCGLRDLPNRRCPDVKKNLEKVTRFATALALFSECSSSFGFSGRSNNF